MARTFEEKNIAEASSEEIRDYATTFLGIPTEGISDAEVRAKVEAATDGETIFVRVSAEPADMAGVPPMAVESDAKLQGGLGHGDPKVTLVLHNEERDGNVVNRHKEVGVNGVVWLLKRGEEISIPYRVFLALNNAERAVITHNGEGEVMTQSVKSTPFNIVAMPSRDEIAAWEARTGGQFVPS